ncbi:zinc ribbon domain-containing protein [Longimicrobium terrae]|uniref:Uncharacterized protein n=1 Tax=Longimicrobium terrae TaxID=1639882 RepID=A0A841GYC9_9BACT|nr:zinc ribbon domain-containing protein [Longimicrobium terrae]MBB4636385.1 hypothetical protein [Longimicrobium terrae]MBB6070781.1 hypothetical protein [Longimicrobium terrae]NNC29761.1 zinc ribbon domain-containing protein [Longimicrobium terrae]
MSDLIGHCPNCQTSIRSDHPYAWCSKCGAPLPAELKAGLNLPATAKPVERKITGPQVGFRVFSSGMLSWEELFADAARFASSVGRDQLINISHSEDDNEGVVTVWYWR